MNELELRVQAIRFEAEGIHRIELRSIEGTALPPFEAGAHIDLELGAGRWRSYSLCNSPADRSRYLLAVQLDPASRGGSRHAHESLRVGQRVGVRGPRNQFALVEDADVSVLVAGGIGITPLLAMAERLSTLGRRWDLHYFARGPESLALRFRAEALAAAGPGRRLFFHFKDSPERPDVADIVRDAPSRAHLYCCGPQRMLQAFEAACEGRPADHVHLERFAASEAPAVAGGFTVRLARAGVTIPVAPGSTILEALLARGIDVPHSCVSGICGSCEVRVLEGVPDHRDEVLSAAERASNRTMLVCCSGSMGDRLVLDL